MIFGLVGVEMFLIKPLLGWGALGTLEHGIDFMYNNGNVIHSHNIWLTFLVSGGILAFSIYIFVKIKIFKDLLIIYIRYDYLCMFINCFEYDGYNSRTSRLSVYAPQLGMLFIAANSILFNIANGRIKENEKIEEGEIEDCNKDMVAN